MMEVKTVSLVIAAYNSADMLKISLPENLTSGFAAVIIVDGKSMDSTSECVKGLQERYPGMIKFYQIPKCGLANARNFGSSKAETEIVMHAGPDNIISSEVLHAMCQELDKYDLISCQTRRAIRPGYLSKAHDIYKKRYAPGPQKVVGTPYLGRTALFREFLFNEKMLNSDDTELCQRLTDAGKTIFRSPVICQEIGFEGLADIVERWTRWGRGDALFYRSQQANWSLGRKLCSWLHPCKAEVVDCLKVLSSVEFLYVLPFLLFVLCLRYWGWLRFVIFGGRG